MWMLASLACSFTAIYASLLSRLKPWVFRITREGQFDRALRWDNMLRRLPLYGTPLKGSILFFAGRYPEARAYLKPLAFDTEGNPRLQSRELYLYALSLVNDAREPEAEVLLDAAIRMPQPGYSLHVALATCLLAQDKNPQRACSLLEQAIQSKTASAKTYGQKADEVRRIARYAWALACCGRRSEAEARINEALAASATFKSYDLGGVQYYAGETWRALGQSLKASAAFDQALQLCPEGSVATSTHRALAKMQAG
jgi:tetratricopeptide (TPR) repeat protein